MDNFPIAFQDEKIIIRPKIAYRAKNRLWHIAGHKLRAPSTVITATSQNNRFTVSDVDDPDVYAGQPIYDWEQTEAGKWVMTNAYHKPSWHRQMDYSTYGYKYIIKADLTPEQITYVGMQSTALADSVTIDTATFNSKTIPTPPTGFPAIDQEDFQVYVNGVLIPINNRTVAQS